MGSKEDRFEYNIPHAMAACVIAAILYIAFLTMCGIVPFGDNSWIIKGMERQYADYFTFFKTVIAGQNDFFYSFDGTLGRSMVGFCTYYLTSPFLFITLLFPPKALPMAVSLIAGLKLALCAFTFDMMLQRLCGRSTYLCSVTYALCGYMIYNVPNLMWLDVLILFPLAVIALEALIKDGKLMGYTICTALIIYLNYFMGYMVLAFLLLWTIVRVLIEVNGNRQEIIMRWGVATTAGIGIDAFVLLPAILELRDISLTYDVTYSRMDISLLYSGIPVMIFAILYFFSRKIPARERFVMFLLMILLGVSYTWKNAAIMWHFLFKSADGSFPEAFAGVFVTLVCACRFLQVCDLSRSKRIIAILFCLLTTVIQFGDTLRNGTNVYKADAADVKTASEYAKEYDMAADAIEYIKKNDVNFWRMDSRAPARKNDGMAHDYRSLTYSGTSELVYSRDFLYRLGYDTGRNYVDYGCDNTETADSILGIRYVMADATQAPLMHREYKLAYDGDTKVYVNPYSLPVALGVYREMSGESSDPFSMQEDIYGRLAGEPADIFVYADSEYIESDNSRPVREYEVKAAADGEMYMYISDLMDDDAGLEIYLNNEFVCYYGEEISKKVINLGYYKKGESLLVHLIASDSSEFGNVIFATEDTKALEEAYKKTISRHGLVRQIKPSSLYITLDSAYTVGDDISGEVGVFTTIPYQKGWKAKVAGVKVEPIEVYDALVYIPVTEALQQAELMPDENIRIELYFVPDGFYFGILVSLVSVFIIVLMAIIKNSEASFFEDDYEEEQEEELNEK